MASRGERTAAAYGGGSSHGFVVVVDGPHSVVVVVLAFLILVGIFACPVASRSRSLLVRQDSFDDVQVLKVLLDEGSSSGSDVSAIAPVSPASACCALARIILTSARIDASRDALTFDDARVEVESKPLLDAMREMWEGEREGEREGEQS